MSSPPRRPVPREDVLSVLHAALAILQQPGAFTTGAYARDSAGKALNTGKEMRAHGRRFDLLGAIEAATADAELHNACTVALQRHVREIAAATDHAAWGVSLITDQYGWPAARALLLETTALIADGTITVLDAWTEPPLPDSAPTREEYEELLLEHQMVHEHYFASDWWAGQRSATPSEIAAVDQRVKRIDAYLAEHAAAVAVLDAEELARHAAEHPERPLVHAAPEQRFDDDIPF